MRNDSLGSPSVRKVIAAKTITATERLHRKKSQRHRASKYFILWKICKQGQFVKAICWWNEFTLRIILFYNRIYYVSIILLAFGVRGVPHELWTWPTVYVMQSHVVWSSTHKKISNNITNLFIFWQNAINIKVFRLYVLENVLKATLTFPKMEDNILFGAHYLKINIDLDIN